MFALNCMIIITMMTYHHHHHDDLPLQMLSQYHCSSVIVTVMVVMSHHNDDIITRLAAKVASCRQVHANHSESRIDFITLAADNSLHLASEYICPLLHSLYISITQSSHIHLTWLFFTL